MENMNLIGADDVRRGGQQIAEDARQMSNVSSNFQCVIEANQRFMDDWLNRFTQALENTSLKEKAGPTEAGSGEPTRFPSIHLRRLRASEKEAREELRRSRESEDMLRKALEQIRKMIPE